ncbi:MAG: hypothetical protein ACXVA9_07570 [Bdellovibrionales bacterium]
MKSFTGFFKILVFVIVLLVIGTLVITNYEWVFSKRVTGQVVDVERVTDPQAVLGNRMTEAQMYSYSILIQGDDGHLYTSSSEDRQWQVVKKGYCVEALLFRYPPWVLDKAGTFFNARLKDVKICPGQTALPAGTQGPAGPGSQPQIFPAGDGQPSNPPATNPPAANPPSPTH